MYISSRQNPHFKKWQSLLSSHTLEKQKAFLLSGRKVVPEYLHHPWITQWLAPHSFEKTSSLKPPKKLSAYELSFDLFRDLDIFNTQFPLLVGKLPSLCSDDGTQPPKGLEVFSALGDPSNLGALIRTCCALDVSKILLLKESAHPFHPKSLKASSGSVLKAPLFQGPFLKDLKPTENLVCLDPQGQNLYDFPWPQDVQLLVGEEGAGLPEHFKEHATCLAISMNPKIESLNATVATSLAVFHYQMHHRKS